MPIRTGTKLEALHGLLKRTEQEISCARQRDRDTTELRALRDRIRAQIEPTETQQRNIVDRRLDQLHVTARDVKVWAHANGLVDAVKRGRVGEHLVEAYATAMGGRQGVIEAAGRGPCRDCAQITLYEPYWQDGTTDQRAQWKRWGLCRAACRGYCARCYVRLKRHGELDRHETRVIPGKQTCRRCGLTNITTDEDRLCADCVDVLAIDGQEAIA